MEDVLEVYHRPHDPDRPVVCLDETSKQLIAETRVPIPAKPGHPKRHDYEYQRNGTANLFMMFAPLEGWRHFEVTDRHTAVEHARILKDLSDKHFPDVSKIVLVQDNLNTHKPASLYEAFPAAEARRLVASGATGLISFGLAGGLDPALRAGGLLAPTAVWVDGRSMPTDAALSQRLGGRSVDPVLGARDVVATASDKAALFAATGAVAVDLESGAVARVAAEHGPPFAVLRAVCDPAERDLPPAALIALDRHGAIGSMRVVGSVLAHPAQIQALVALGVDAAAARRALRAAVASVGRMGAA